MFKGQDLQTGRLVAIKQLQVSSGGISAESMASVMGEIELLKNLNHQNIVQYLGYYKTRSHLYIILEYMENGALSSVIKPHKYGAFPESLVAVYIAQVLKGLAYLHEQGVVHRDIKGANILTTLQVSLETLHFSLLLCISAATPCSCPVYHPSVEFETVCHCWLMCRGTHTHGRL